MRRRKTVAAAIGFLLLGLFAAGCSSFRENTSPRRVFSPWSWLKSTQMKKNDLALFTSTVRPQPGNPWAHYTLGSYYLQSERHDEAVSELKKAVAIKPDYFEAYNLLAVSYDRQGDFENAEKAYHVAIKINPNVAYLYNNMGHSYILQGKWQEALETLKKAVELNGSKSSRRMYNNLGLAYVMTGHDQEGMMAFEQAGGKAEAHYKMARTYAYKGMFDEANKHCALALELNPTSDDYRKGFRESEQKAEAVRFASQIRQAIAQSTPVTREMIEKDHEGLMNDVGIEISNGNGISGLARKVGRFLKERGYAVVRLTNADSFNFPETTIYYRKGYDTASRALAKQMPEMPSAEEVKRFDRPLVKIKMVLGKDITAYKEAFTEGNEQ